MKKYLTVLFTFLLVVGLTSPVYARNDKEFKELKEEITYINSLSEDEIVYLVKNDQKYLEKIEEKLEKYLSKLDPEEQSYAMKLLHGANPLLRSSSVNMDVYFNSWVYHLRNNYWTYSLSPKWSVRLFYSTFLESYETLKTNYYHWRNNSDGMLYKQYYCHYLYDASFGLLGDWDIEEGVPSIPWDQMFNYRCNSQGEKYF